VTRNLALEMVRVTEAAALSGAQWLGKGDKNAADQVRGAALSMAGSAQHANRAHQQHEQPLVLCTPFPSGASPLR
jgi:Bacterial fructose-1,6-bisphosphatase, glpX-encoded